MVLFLQVGDLLPGSIRKSSASSQFSLRDFPANRVAAFCAHARTLAALTVMIGV